MPTTLHSGIPRSKESDLLLQYSPGNHYDTMLRALACCMLVAAVVWLGYQFWRLIWQPGEQGAIDLKYLHTLVHGWFAGTPAYRELPGAIHPPATYAILWPLLGWLEFTPARWLWALTTVPALAWLAHLVVRESKAETPLERTVAALIPFSMYATGAAIGNGQQIVHILPMLVAALLLLKQQEPTWRMDLLAAALLLITFVKPNISLPFFWLVIFISKSWRPACLVSIAYIALTFFAVSFQDSNLRTLTDEWLARSSRIAVGGEHGNVANLHVWLGSLGLAEWLLPASLIVLFSLGIWTYHYRNIDLWIAIGVTAYVSRFWAYHRWYDDLLILLPMIALFRIVKQHEATAADKLLASALLGVTVVVMLAPGGLFLLSPPWNEWFVKGQIIVWVGGLVFLLKRARNEKKPLNSFGREREKEACAL